MVLSEVLWRLMGRFFRFRRSGTGVLFEIFKVAQIRIDVRPLQYLTAAEASDRAYPGTRIGIHIAILGRRECLLTGAISFSMPIAT